VVVEYIAGNLGENSYFKASSARPMSIYAKDFDKNGLYDPFIACYGQDSVGNQHEYFYPTRDDMIKQLITIRRKFQTYGAFGQATVQDVFTKEELQGAQVLKANWLKSSYLENKGNGQFVLSALPVEAQMAPIYGILPYDFDKNGFLDVVLVGNDYGMELLQGRADAFNGLILKNMGQQGFKPLTLDESHFFVPNDAKSLTRVAIGNQKELILASQNKGAFKVFAPKTPVLRVISVLPNEVKAIITFKNGQKQLKEFYRGSTFLSQESRTMQIYKEIQVVEFFDIKNKLTRKLANT
jgi:enediyne biosynthesis protein E4